MIECKLVSASGGIKKLRQEHLAHFRQSAPLIKLILLITRIDDEDVCLPLDVEFRKRFVKRELGKDLLSKKLVEIPGFETRASQDHLLDRRIQRRVMSHRPWTATESRWIGNHFLVILVRRRRGFWRLGLNLSPTVSRLEHANHKTGNGHKLSQPRNRPGATRLRACHGNASLSLFDAR